jgi:hypothetical protein
VAQENPLGLGIGALAVGFLAGMLTPTTRLEDERIGPMSDHVKAQAADTAQEALEHGRQVAQDTVMAAQKSAQQHGRQMAETVNLDAQASVGAVKASATGDSEGY